jgi:HAD superfamily hydrolase (TIGR01509 family)
MTPDALMRGRSAPLHLVIFDCDGVIVDSEPIANRVVAEDLTRQGWPMTPAEADGHFLGMTFTDMVPVIETRLGRALSMSWKQSLMETLVKALSHEAQPIPGAIEALHATSALGLPWRIASNSSHEEMQVKFACIGITGLVTGRVHSHRDVARGKPAPDLFLATAAAQGVAPEHCVVIEDSTTGARAAAAAGMDCLGIDRRGMGEHLRAVGAVPFTSMFDLPGLLALAQRKAA